MGFQEAILLLVFPIWDITDQAFRILVFNTQLMYAIPKDKRKITPKLALQILEKEGAKMSLEEVEIILEMMYNFAKLALNQQLQLKSEGRNQLIQHPEPG